MLKLYIKRQWHSREGLLKFYMEILGIEPETLYITSRIGLNHHVTATILRCHTWWTKPQVLHGSHPSYLVSGGCREDGPSVGIPWAPPFMETALLARHMLYHKTTALRHWDLAYLLGPSPTTCSLLACPQEYPLPTILWLLPTFLPDPAVQHGAPFLGHHRGWIFPLQTGAPPYISTVYSHKDANVFSICNIPGLAQWAAQGAVKIAPQLFSAWCYCSCTILMESVYVFFY